MGCGCAERKDIMFVQGKPGITEGVIILTAALAVIIAYKINKG